MTHTSPQSLELVQITEEELIDYTRRQNALSWKGVLQEHEYVEREYVLGKSRMMLNPGHGLLVLALRDGNDEGNICCSMEVMLRKSWKFVFDEVSGEVKQIEIMSGCIGGVFTPPEKRGNGYAKIMIDKAVDICKSKFIGVDGFMFLYSEIGEYYAKHGFKSLPVPLIKVAVGDNTTTFRKLSSALGHKINLMSYQQDKEAFSQYSAAHQKQLHEKTSEDHKTRVAVIPSLDYVDWFHLRAKFISHKLFHENLSIDSLIPYQELIQKYDTFEPHNFGIEIRSSYDALEGFISWTYDWSYNEKSQMYESKVTVLKTFVSLEFDQEEYTLNLFKLMVAYFEELNGKKAFITPITETVLWTSEVSDTIGQQILEEFHGEVEENSSRSAFMPLNDLDKEMFDKGDYIWENNTKLPWF